MKLTIILFRNNFRFSEKQQRWEGSSCPCLPHLPGSQQPGASVKTKLSTDATIRETGASFAFHLPLH